MPITVVAADTAALRAEAYALRHRVFVVEQKVPVELERDAQDDAAFHAVALDGARCVGTGRLVRQPDGTGRIGRMAVDAAYRRAGVGARVLAALEAHARAEGIAEIELHAQCYVEAFYRRHGYAPVGDVFEEAGIAHVVMRKRA
ncbi:GNAT family N-acetyltransferase [Anaeromyxobacter oryzae]|uniref:Acetyltransferase n=1 Tax=Anaeromyxobacter oryzae TaxID=2918170 RepID=A0ABN6MSS2_9BACT|nr:GNAT family N-acetyltransferase [Anaeromyxobacter oryzae]BDG03325.1 acetyltransferase [Anaeromyxobacter oryzae]